MNAAERDQFLSQPRTGVLSTTDRAGRIHAVPVWYEWTGEEFRIFTERGSAKHRNVERLARASLCIDDRTSFAWVTAEGVVTVTDPVSMEERLALHTLYRGAERAREVVAQGGHEKMVILHLRPERWWSS